MLALGIIIVVAVGLMAVHIVSPRMSWVERIGLAFPVGMGIQTMIMALIDMCSVPLTSGSMIVSGIVAALVLAAGCRIRGMRMRHVPREPYAPTGEYNLVWLLLMCLIVYFEYMNFSKCMYFPTFDRDSLAGFDTIGYVIAKEHTFGMMSLFDTLRSPHIHNAGSYITYAPMTQLSYAYVYLLGAETSKLIPALMYLSFIIAFYGVVSRVTGRTIAAAATLLMMITPEMISFSSMSATNCIHAVSASLGVIYVALWFRERRQGDLALGALLLALNVWTRTDGVVFVLAALVAVGVVAVRQRRWRWILTIGCAFIPMLLWWLFCKVSGFYAEGIVIMFPFWDAEKAGAICRGIWSLVCNTDRYGVTFLFFGLAVIANAWFVIKRRDNLPLLAMMLMAILLYMVMLYQIDYKWDTMGNVLAYSAKRFLFCFVPLAWFFAVTGRWCVLLSARVEKLLS